MPILAGAACALLVPLALLLPYLGGDGETETGWALERIDIVALVFCLLAAGLLAASLRERRRSLCLGAAALLFAVFGLVLAFPLEFPALVDGTATEIGGYLAPLAALLGAGAAAYAGELSPRD